MSGPGPSVGDAHHVPRDRHGRQILTVGALRQLLVGLGDETHVVLARDDDFTNVGEVVVPGPAGDYIALTLYPGFDVDSRQF